MIALRLFLPESLTSHAARLKRAGVPVEYRTHKAVIDRRWQAISFWATALEHVYEPADHASVVCSLDAAHIRFNPCPLLVAQPEQIPPHRIFPNTNQNRCECAPGDLQGVVGESPMR